LSSKIKWILIIFGCVVGLAGIVGCIFSVVTYTDKLKTLEEEKNLEIEILTEELSAYGDTVTIYVLNQDVVSGQNFSMDQVVTEEVPSVMLNEEYITQEADLANAIYKVNASAGTPLVYSVITHELIAHDSRYYDLVAHSFPVTMRIGDYVDLRLITSYGQDYLVLPKKRIQMINNNSIRLTLGEEEIHKYNSALVDTAINPGSALYFTTYVEPAHQKEAQSYYAVSQDVLDAMSLDPNMPLIAELEVMSRRRELFETSLAMQQDQTRNQAAVAGRDDQLAKLLEDIEAYRAQVAEGIIDPDTGYATQVPGEEGADDTIPADAPPEEEEEVAATEEDPDVIPAE
jgi:hypothetical protein